MSLRSATTYSLIVISFAAFFSLLVRDRLFFCFLFDITRIVNKKVNIATNFFDSTSLVFAIRLKENSKCWAPVLVFDLLPVPALPQTQLAVQQTLVLILNTKSYGKLPTLAIILQSYIFEPIFVIEMSDKPEIGPIHWI